MTSRRLIVWTLLAAAGLAAAARSARRSRAWVGLHLEDGMLLALGPDDPGVPGVRSAAGEVIRVLQTGTTRWRSPRS